jgi:RNA polymerase sigma-70 factor (sigma-E family)
MLILRTQNEPLLRTAAQGTELGELFANHAPRAMRLAFLLTGNRAAAEDLVQEAFVRVIAKSLRLRESNAFGAYLRTTIVNLHTSALRRRKVERRYLVAESGRPLAEVGVPDLDLQTEMWGRLGLLPARQRAALVLRYYEDLSGKQVAQCLGCSHAAARTLISRGLESLRAGMEGDE